MTELRIPSSDSVSLALHDLRGNGPTILMAHGTGFHGRINLSLASKLSDFHSWAPDLRGHGNSGLPDREFSWRGFSEDLEAVVEAISPEQPVFGFAHSMGAAASLILEARRPGTFRALYCYEPIVIPLELARIAEEHQKDFRSGVRKRRQSFPTPRAAFDRYSSKPPFENLETESLNAYIEHGFRPCEDGSIQLKMHPQDEARVFEMDRQQSIHELLPTIGCSVVVAHGRLHPGPPRWAADVAAAIPHATLESYDDLGHLGPYEDSQRIALAIRRHFLAPRGVRELS